jgi:hypothetical protein
LLKFIAKTGSFLLGLFLFLELVFRFVILASSDPVTIQNPDYKIMQYDPSGPLDGIHTEGRLGQHRAHWRVNNLGWISAEDYSLKENKVAPRVVIIGNSYVEGKYLDVENHLAPVARKLHGGTADIYTLGIGGVDLGQGMQVTDYAREVLAPDLVVLVVSHGMLRRSVRNLANRPYCLQVEFGEDGQKVRQPRTFRQHSLAVLLKKSATVRYIRKNAKVALGGGAQEEKASPSKLEDINAMHREWEMMQLGAEWIVSTLEKNNPGTRFVFLVDADRNEIHAGRKPEPIPASDLLSKAAIDRDGFQVLDLTETLWQDYQNSSTPFHTPSNYHWNSYAVKVIARVLSDYIEGKGLLEKQVQ